MGIAGVLGCAVALVSLGVAGAPVVHAAPATGQVVVVQAVPGSSVEVSIDGREVAGAAEVGEVLGPFDLAAGTHEVRFDGDDGLSVASDVGVRPGGNIDVVLHRPAARNGAPVVHSYRTPMEPIGEGKARVLVAHTATVPPADVRVDGKVVFTNIANGEFAEAEVPAGDHVVECLPTGRTDNPILGPLDLTLEPRTITMVYAVGSPTNGSMDVIVHTARLESDGAGMPDRIVTGSAGLAPAVAPSPFGSAPWTRAWPGHARAV